MNCWLLIVHYFPSCSRDFVLSPNFVFAWFDVILILWILSLMAKLVSSAPPSPSIIIFFCLFLCTFLEPFFHHHFLFPLLLHFSSTFLLFYFLSIYNCHYLFFFSKWHFELVGLIGLPVVAQRQTLYICSVEPAQAAATNTWFFFFFSTWNDTFNLPCLQCPFCFLTDLLWLPCATSGPPR